MSLLGRNVTGDDVLALWVHIDRHSPVERKTLLRRFYPGDEEDPNQSNYRKTLEDAIDFLEESDQIVNEENGYTIRDSCGEAVSPRISILKGIRSQSDEDKTYSAVLDVLTEEDIRYFDASNQLDDLLSTNLSSVNWTENKIDYWTRVMSMLGIVAPVNAESSEEYTHVLSLSQPLLQEILKDSTSPNEPTELRSLMQEIHETHIPVFGTGNRDSAARFFQRALGQAVSNGSIELAQSSDFGETILIEGSGYNSLTLRTSGNS